MFLPALNLILAILLPVCDGETEPADTIREAVHVSTYKQILPVESIASPVTVVSVKEMQDRGLDNTKGFSSVVPNLHIPDYGSAMTSSIYLRGFGSRIDNPVIGLYIDDIPVMNKNAYDFDFSDISEAFLLRGPQSTLYGRNSMCGVLSLNTFSPENTHGIRAGFEYGNANTLSARFAVYGNSGLGFSAGYKHSDGFHTNYSNGKLVDRYDALNLRFRAWKKIRPDLEFENILTLSLLDQGGYPYREYNEETGELERLSFNDYCGYRRISASEGLKFKYMSENYTLSSVTSIQALSDEMKLDQDFTDRSMFTLRQSQNEGALTQELILKPEIGWRTSWWNWQTGFFGFVKYNDMAAPVRFKRDGINELILANANKGMAMVGKKLDLQENEFDITSDFGILTYGLALYHESDFELGRWLLSAGLRFDYEGAGMSYNSRAGINYRLSDIGAVSKGDYSFYECIYEGYRDNSYFEVLPKFSVIYDGGPVKAFANVSRGYKAGGFNVQIFSDILQNKMMNGLMEELGVYLDQAQDTGAGNTVYKPETSLSTELGLRFDVPAGEHRVHGSVSVYHIACSNQQITVFPPGKNTGRMMANAGKSRSFGAEAELGYSWKGLAFNAAYGYCNARFVDYDDGHQDWSGKRIPYSPEHTLNSRVAYTWDMHNDAFRSITASVNVICDGRVWWNESNTLSQPFHVLLGADVRASFKWFDLYLRGENLTDSLYRTFYFKSVGRSFFQVGKPLRFTLGMSLDL